MFTCWAGMTTIPCCAPALNAACCCIYRPHQQISRDTARGWYNKNIVRKKFRGALKHWNYFGQKSLPVQLLTHVNFN